MALKTSVILAACFSLVLGFDQLHAQARQSHDPWSPRERALLRDLWVGNLPVLKAASFLSNPYALRADAAALGKDLFFDKSLSRDGNIACAECHDPAHAFAGHDTFLVAGQGQRKAPTLIGVAWQSWFFWDGRKDSLWSQALAPIENPAEFNLSRGDWVKRVMAKYGTRYQAIFGRAEPNRRPNIEEEFANLGKAIAAFETTLAPAPSEFDRFLEHQLGLTKNPKPSPAESPEESPAFGECESAGLKIFIGKGRCVECHNGPRFENGSFHNTGVPLAGDKDFPGGRYLGLIQAMQDPFNCAGIYGARAASKRLSDSCPDLAAAPVRSTLFSGAFKTPTLRNVGKTAPYMHGGQFQTLEQVVQHYAKAPSGPIGSTELLPIEFTEEEGKSLVCFLKKI